MTKQNALVGRTITKLLIAEDREAILFQTTEGDIKVRCDADCCSHTWVEHIELPVNGFPATVSAVVDIELNAELDTRDNELAFYGCKIVTDKGDIIIDYRNESNGYYGGSLCWPGEGFYGGVGKQNASKEKWLELAA